MGAGKSHTVRWMWEAGHVPLEAIVHRDPDLFKTAMPAWGGHVALDPMSAGQRTQRESGYLVEIAQAAAAGALEGETLTAWTPRYSAGLSSQLAERSERLRQERAAELAFASRPLWRKALDAARTIDDLGAIVDAALGAPSPCEEATEVGAS